MKSLQLQLVLAVLAVACGGEVGAGTDVGGREQDESSSVSSGSGSDASSSFTGHGSGSGNSSGTSASTGSRTTSTTSGSSRVTETGVPSSGGGSGGGSGSGVPLLPGCQDLDVCCEFLPAGGVTACQDVANSDNGDECGSLSTAFANSGYCTGTSPPPRTPMWCTGLGFCCRASANQEACAGIAAGGDESACALALSTYCIE